MPILFLIVGLIIGLVVGWLIFNGASSTGDAKAITNNSINLGDAAGASCTPVPHTCSGTVGICTTNTCVTNDGKSYFDCSHCNFETSTN